MIDLKSLVESMAAFGITTPEDQGQASADQAVLEAIDRRLTSACFTDSQICLTGPGEAPHHAWNWRRVERKQQVAGKPLQKVLSPRIAALRLAGGDDLQIYDTCSLSLSA